MYAKIVGRDQHYERSDFWTDYWIEGDDRKGKPFKAIASFGFVYDKEDDGYYLICSVIWNGELDYDGWGQELISRESVESGRFSPRVKREMEELLKEMLDGYPEFEEIEEFLGWGRP